MFEPATRFVPSEDGVEVAVHDYGGTHDFCSRHRTHLANVGANNPKAWH